MKLALSGEFRLLIFKRAQLVAKLRDFSIRILQPPHPKKMKGQRNNQQDNTNPYPHA